MATQNSQSGLEVAHKAYEKPYEPYVATQAAPAPQPYQSNPEVGAVRSEKTVCGVRRPTFWLTMALMVVILAAGIGGGVGGRLAVKNMQCANRECTSSSSSGSGSNSNSNNNQDTLYVTRTRTVTATSATTGASTFQTDITVPTDGFLALDCPSLTNTNIRAFDQTFRVTCGQDSAGPDIIAVVAYSLLDCARACAAYNTNSGSNLCKGATFNSYLRYVEAHKGTCWLKNSTGSPIIDGLPGVDPNSYAQMILQ